MAKIKIGNRYFDSVQGVVVNDENGDKSLYSKPSWAENNEVKAGYIEDRPFYHKAIEEGSATRDTEATPYTLNIGGVNVTFSSQEETFNLQDPYTMTGVSIQTEVNGPFYEIKGYIKSAYELSQYQASSALVGAIVDGPVINLPSAITALILINNTGYNIICFYSNTKGILDGANSPIGFYVNTNLPTTWYYKNYFPIVINERYREFFQSMKTPIYVMSSSLADFTDLDFSNFAPGDIVLGVLEQ